MTADVVADRHIVFGVELGVASLTVQRPDKRNAFTAAMWSALRTELDAAAERDDVRCLVVTGSGGSFSAGADLASVRGADGAESPEYRRTALAGIRAVREFPFPTLALIDGACVGAGCSVALACDVRMATPAAFFAVPAVRYGFEYEEWGVRRLVELMGSGQASRFLFSGRRVEGAEAARVGLVEECVEDLPAAATSYLAALVEGHPTTLATTRDLIRRFAGGADDGGGGVR